MSSATADRDARGAHPALPTLEIVADFRGVGAEVAEALVSRWADADRLAALAVGAVYVVPDGTAAPQGLPRGWIVRSAPVTGVFWDAVLHATGAAGRPALVLLAPVEPALDAAGAMLSLLGTGDVLGAVVARLQCEAGCCVEALQRPGADTAGWLPQAVIADLPPSEFAGDPVGVCTLVAPTVLADFDDPDTDLTSLEGVLRQRLYRARRCGLRSLLANRALVRRTGAACAAPPPVTAVPAVDAPRLRAYQAELDRDWLECRGAAHARYERLAGRRLTLEAGRRPAVLLDLRNLRDSYNGTAFAALGIAHGLRQAAPDWDVEVVAHPLGARFHDLEHGLGGWPIHTGSMPEGFDAALRLSQPWHVSDMVELHGAARINVHLMLDTIAWDVQHSAPPHLDGAWHFLEASADGLLFISECSRQRFHARFDAGAGPVDEVCHLSFAPDDYTRADLRHEPPGDYLLVVGNALDHKDVAPTVTALASAFPTLRLEVLGPSPLRASRIASHPSGQLADDEVHRLYARARFVVFPSFSEGFGFPVVTALAYRRTLLARSSPLLDEIAPYCVPGGTLVSYATRDELIDRVGRLMHGAPVRVEPIGARRDGAPRSWLDVGRQIRSFTERLIASRALSHYRDRERLVAQVRAALSPRT